MKYKIYGTDARVQIEIIDLTADDIPSALRKDKISVYAYMLLASAHKNAAFSMVGKPIYGGHSLKDCLSVVKQKLKLNDIKLPSSFNQYQ